jgi:hypothetical protein
MARKLVANGAHSFYRVLVDPLNGAPLEIGRTSYRLTEAMKRWIRMRDGHCTFPGCTNHSTDNETDHLTAWQHHGTTGVSNLAQLCPKHHRLKHNSGWTPTPATETEPPGWTSPTGRHYPAHQPDPQPPHWPPGLLSGRAALPSKGTPSRSALPSGRSDGMTGTPGGSALPPGGTTPGRPALPSGRPDGMTGTSADDTELSPLEAVLTKILAA